jgi:hypothetical protein
MDQSKICTKCKEIKDIENFSKNKIFKNWDMTYFLVNLELDHPSISFLNFF